MISRESVGIAGRFFFIVLKQMLTVVYLKTDEFKGGISYA